MRQCEYKKRYDPDLDLCVRQHIYGEGLFDVFKSAGRKLTSKFGKKAAKKVASKAASKAVEKTGEYTGKKAGDKIVEILRKEPKPPPTPTPTRKQIEPLAEMVEIQSPPMPVQSEPRELTPQEARARVRQLISGGKLRKRHFI